MNFAEGQNACGIIGGHLIEPDKKTNFTKKIEIVASKFALEGTIHNHDKIATKESQNFDEILI